MFVRWSNMDVLQLLSVIAHSVSRIWMTFFRTDKYDFDDVEKFKAILKELRNTGWLVLGFGEAVARQEIAPA